MEAKSPTPLRRERLARRWTMRQLGVLCGLTESAISRYETGDRLPDEPTRDRIAKELGVAPEHLWPAAYGIQGPAEAVA